MPTRSTTTASCVSLASTSPSPARSPSRRDRLLTESQETELLEPTQMVSQHTETVYVLPESFLHLYRKQQQDVDDLLQEYLQKAHDFGEVLLHPLKLLQGFRNGVVPLSDGTQVSLFETRPDVLREGMSMGKPSEAKRLLSLKDLGLFRGDPDSLESFLAQVRHCQEHWPNDDSRRKILRSLPLCMAGPAWPWYQRLSQSFKDENLKDLAGWEYELRREFSSDTPAEVGLSSAEEYK
ncbi:hypothetical protein BCV69DRAFT_298754 [Microstroma glucosiphilum]|uniref:Uncharacterized protein n=1 Tax=Pseudomicrostroma glucosiphilum TaxID=1684307 RepID=A0A316U7Z1_9BASI|nr:hypothetical protein BCV69DRAFT_298754 [Pseudomicrostroma glucosiphilum]PWN20958.1 hypothetical protein BCV69DRAFT_298754 [Pseudomicrostroma glucosiphilum]